MAYDTYYGDPADDQAKIQYYLELLTNAMMRRSNFEGGWEENAALCWPEYRGTFTFGSVRSPGVKYAQFQLDTAGSIASQQFMAIADGLLTPFNMLWSVMRANDKSLMRARRVKEYFAAVTTIMWDQRYRWEANFTAQNSHNMACLGVFGNMAMMSEELAPSPGMESGVRYIACGPGEIYILTNYQGRVDGFIKHFRWNARQANQKWPGTIGKPVRDALERGSLELFDFLLFCLPRTDYNPHAVLTPQSKPWSGCYVDYSGRRILEEGGFRTFPLAYGRYEQAPGEDHGRGPTDRCKPALKTLNAEKGIFLTQGHRASDPTILLAGDDSLDFKNYPGSMNYGFLDEQGHRLADILPAGNIAITEKMMAMEQKQVDSAFLLNLFPVLFRNMVEGVQRQRGAREVVEDLVDRALFLAPTLGRQFSDYLGPLIEHEADMLSYQRKFPPMPPELKEAKGQYKTVFASPLALALRLQPIAGFMRTVDIANAVAQASGSNEVMDIFEFDMAMPDIAEDQFVPPAWMATDKRIAQKRQGRAKAQQQQDYIKSLPGLAARDKAQAITAKAQTGGNIGGTLSGTPEGGMPQMPGQSAPGGRSFG